MNASADASPSGTGQAACSVTGLTTGKKTSRPASAAQQPASFPADFSLETQQGAVPTVQRFVNWISCNMPIASLCFNAALCL